MSKHGDGAHRVAVIGGGFCGLIAGVALQQAGVRDFVIYEREAGYGGTWYVNTFPGCGVDTESEVYRLSYAPYAWSRSHASQSEVLGYIRAVAEKHGLGPHFRCSTSVRSVRWDAGENRYDIDLGDGRVEHADAVISAVGLLSEPRYPEWAKGGAFAGPIVHTANWDHALDFAGKRVAVVGTGSTSAQVVPELAKQAEHVFVFQRQPGWVFPKAETDFGRVPDFVTDPAKVAEHQAARTAGLAAAAQMFADGRGGIVGSAENEAGRAFALKFIQDSFADRPDLIPLVTPSYPIMGKRPVMSNDFYPALKRSNVTLVPHAVERLTPSGVVDDTGEERAVDAVILATGFHAAEYLRSFDVIGRDGVSLREFWGDEPKAYLGMMVPNFPNFFIMYGPNTNATLSLMPMFEAQAAFAADVVTDMSQRHVEAVEVKPSTFNKFDAWLGEQLANSASSTTRNYFQSKSGRIVTNWPRSVELYLKMLAKARDEALVDVAPASTGSRETAA